MKKIISSLHCKTKIQTHKMQRLNLHIETKKWFSPLADISFYGALSAVS